MNSISTQSQEDAPEPQFADPGEKLVLLIDDDESLLDLLERVVIKEGFRTDRATDGAKAMRKVEAAVPDLVILDLMLPGKGGYEVLRELQTGDAARVPVIVITGCNIDSRHVDAVRQELNLRDFVRKPLHPSFLAAKIHTILKTRPRLRDPS